MKEVSWFENYKFKVVVFSFLITLRANGNDLFLVLENDFIANTSKVSELLILQTRSVRNLNAHKFTG